jgi:hypothetical protein
VSLARCFVRSGHGVAARPNIVVSDGLAAAVTAAWVLSLRRQRSRYRPNPHVFPDIADDTEGRSTAAARIRAAYHRRTRAAQIHDGEADEGFGLNVGGHDGDPAGARAHRDPGSAATTRVPDEDVLVAHLVARLRDIRVGANTPKSAERSAAGHGGDAPRSQGDVREADAAALPFGVRTDREVVVDLSTIAGLGLVGEGALAAARALLLSAVGVGLTGRSTPPPALPPAPGRSSRSPSLSPPPSPSPSLLPALSPVLSPGVEVVVVADLLTDLFGPDLSRLRLPPTVRVLEGEAALAAADAAIPARARRGGAPRAAGTSGPGLLLVAPGPPDPATDHSRWGSRLQAVLHRGAAGGVVGLLVGAWWPAGWVYVGGEGLVGMIPAGLPVVLRGARVFGLGAAESMELLGLFADVYPGKGKPRPPTDRGGRRRGPGANQKGPEKDPFVALSASPFLAADWLRLKDCPGEMIACTRGLPFIFSVA